MSLHVRVVDPADNQALLALASAVDTSGGEFHVERAPDFFALGRAFGRATYFGAFDGERLVGCVGVTTQRRWLEGVAREVDYVHDLRVHAHQQRSRILRQLLAAVRAACEQHAGWAFGTILDANARAERLRRGGRLLGPATLVGRTIHVGFPLFVPRHATRTRIVQLPATEAWRIHERLASRLEFSPADRAGFDAPDGVHLGIEHQGRLVGVAKLVDQSAARRIVAAGPGGGPVRIAYLAYRAAEPGAGDLDALLAHVACSERGRFSHVFVGLSEQEAACRRDPFTARLSSTTFAFGNVPPRLRLGCHELTLV